MRQLLMLLAACATHDVLRSESLVSRAACGNGAAVFGYPGEAPVCEADVISLGDGCYVARRSSDQPRLFECAANAPDHHVMCVEDRVHRDNWVFGEDIARTRWVIRLPYVGEQADVTAGRCHTRYEAWELVNLPPLPSPELVVAYWHGVDLPRVKLQPIEDAISLRRIIGFMPHVRARVCPADREPRVELAGDYPAQFAQQLQQLVRRGISDGNFALTQCIDIAFGLAELDRNKSTRSVRLRLSPRR